MKIIITGFEFGMAVGMSIVGFGLVMTLAAATINSIKRNKKEKKND